MSSQRIFTLVLVFALFSGCGKNEDAPAEGKTEESEQDAGGDGDAASDGTDGGRDDTDDDIEAETVVEADDGSATLTIPAGALPEGVAAADISVVRDDSVITDFDGTARAWILSPDGLQLSSPAELRVDADIESNSLFAIAHLTGEEVEFPESDSERDVFDQETGRWTELSVEIEHFSAFAIVVPWGSEDVTTTSSAQAQWTLPAGAIFVGDEINPTLRVDAPDSFTFNFTYQRDGQPKSRRVSASFPAERFEGHLIRTVTRWGSTSNLTGDYGWQYDASETPSVEKTVTFQCNTAGPYTVSAWVHLFLSGEVLAASFVDGEQFGSARSTNFALRAKTFMETSSVCLEPTGAQASASASASGSASGAGGDGGAGGAPPNTGGAGGHAGTGGTGGASTGGQSSTTGGAGGTATFVFDCGNLQVDTGEDCDASDPDPSRVCPGDETCQDCQCAPPFCGDGVKNGDEECDIGESPSSCFSEAPCSSDCTCPPCGNGRIDEGETCDINGNSDDSSCNMPGDCPDTCVCPDQTCGDREVNPAEECETDSACARGEFCGDCACATCPPVGGGEALPSACLFIPGCGNEKVDEGEECDPSAPDSPDCPTGEACSQHECVCERACGNGTIDPGETCDVNGNTTDSSCMSPGDCPSNCVCPGAFCGNGIAEGEEEQCDGRDLKRFTCETFNLVSGTLACNEDCTFNTDGCETPAEPGDPDCPPLEGTEFFSWLTGNSESFGLTSVDDCNQTGCTGWTEESLLELFAAYWAIVKGGIVLPAGGSAPEYPQYLTPAGSQSGLQVVTSCADASGAATVFASQAPSSGGTSTVLRIPTDTNGAGQPIEFISNSTDRIDPQDITSDGTLLFAELRVAQTFLALDTAAGPHDFTNGVPASPGIMVLGTIPGVDRMMASANGDWVVVDTTAALDASDTNGFSDVYLAPVEDNPTFVPLLLSDGDSTDPSANYEGNRVFFVSTGSDIVAGDDNGKRDLFMTERDPDGDGVFDDGPVHTRLVAAGSGEVVAQMPSTTGTGVLVAFTAVGDGIVPEVDASYPAQIYLHNTETSETTLVSRGSDGQPSNGACRMPQISPNADYVAYECRGATNFTDALGTIDIIATPLE